MYKDGNFTNDEKDFLNEIIKRNTIVVKSFVERYDMYKSIMVHIELKDGKVYQFTPENYREIEPILSMIESYNKYLEIIK